MRPFTEKILYDWLRSFFLRRAPENIQSQEELVLLRHALDLTMIHEDHIT